MYNTREIENRQPQGTPVGVSLAAGPDGKPGGSYQFTGQANSYIEFPNDGGLDVRHSITMLCWIYPQNLAGPLFNYKTTGGPWGVHLWVGFPGHLFVRYKRRNYQYLRGLNSTQTLALNQWHFVGASYDYNTGIASLWLNGQQIVQRNIGARIDLATQDDVRMGVHTRIPKYYKGRICAMQVYDVALNEKQINEKQLNGVQSARQGNHFELL